MTEYGLLLADEIRAGGDGRVAVAGQDRGDIEGQAEAKPLSAPAGRGSG